MRSETPTAIDRRVGADRAAAFVVEASGDPGLLIRILAPFARRDIAIDRLACTSERASVRVEAYVGAMPDEAVRQVAGSIRRVVGVVRLDVVTGFAATQVANEPVPTRLCA